MNAIPFRQTQHPQRLTHPSLPGVTVEFVFVTPQIAEEMLGRNTHNRVPRARGISALARDMRNGQFPFNGDTIVQTADGTLIDGQHRLQAIMDSGVSQLMLIVCGLPLEVQATKDTGIVRAFADQLRLGGELNHKLLAATTRKVALWEMGAYLFQSNLKLTQPELAATLEARPELRDNVMFASRHRATKFAPSVTAIAHWLFTAINPEQAEYFLDRVNDGVNLPAGHPALLVRDRYQRDLTRRIRLSEGEQLALLCTAWNAYRDGRNGQTHLKLPANLSSANFPLPR